MVERLTSNAGTGEMILENWDDFCYKLNDISKEDKKNCKYFFDIKFRQQNGWMTICIEDGKVNQSTLINLDGFERPLGAYNDTNNYNEGLYTVARKMLKNLNS